MLFVDYHKHLCITYNLLPENLRSQNIYIQREIIPVFWMSPDTIIESKSCRDKCNVALKTDSPVNRDALARIIILQDADMLPVRQIEINENTIYQYTFIGIGTYTNKKDIKRFCQYFAVVYDSCKYLK